LLALEDRRNTRPVILRSARHSQLLDGPELGDDAEDLQGEATLWTGDVDRVVERPEPRPSGIERLDDLEQVREGAGPTVDPNHDQDVSPSAPLDGALQFRAAAVTAGAVFAEDGLTAGSLQSVDLRIGRLLVGGYAGVADQRHGWNSPKLGVVVCLMRLDLSESLFD
jgi:hypothetical protein